MGRRGVRVFHISDLHMRSIGGPQTDRVRLDAASWERFLGAGGCIVYGTPLDLGAVWAANLAEVRAPVDLVVFTGDLGDWGHPTDYPRALAFLKQTCEALDVPLDRLFVVPGNHDIDQAIQRPVWESLRRDIERDPRACSKWMAGEDRGALRGDNRRDQILERQQAFWAAVATELGRPELTPKHSPHGRLGYRQAVTLPGLSQPIHVIGLDTAWLAGDDGDSGQLRLTEHQVSLLTTTEGGEPLPGFRLALMHHRLADLADGADARKLMVDCVDLLLHGHLPHGHQHEPPADVLQGTDHQLLVLPPRHLSQGFDGRHYPNACQVIDLVLDEHAQPRSAAVRFRAWSEMAMAEGRLRLYRGARGWRIVDDGDVEQEHANANANANAQNGETSPPSPSPPLRPNLIDFTLERQRYARFVGREDVLAQLDQWLLGRGEAGWVVVTGGPGMGKSAILAEWLARREAAGVVVPHHFICRQVAIWDQPEVIVASLAAQIEAMFPALRDPEARPEGRLIELLGRVSKHFGAAGSLVVLVDGLDETRAEPGDNPLPRFLPHVIPAGIRILCAMRPTYPHLRWIEARSPARRIDLDDRRWAESNEAVVRGFWRTVATEYEPPLPAETIVTAIDRAEGNVLHAVMLHDALQGLPAQERRADRIPRGLGGLVGEIWDRAAVHKGVRAGLGLLCAAQEALSLDVICDLAGWGSDVYEERERFLREARQLLLEEPASWSGAVAYRLRHDWVRELMAERLGATTVRAHHGTLSRKLATWPPTPAEPIVRQYALRHALLHRVEAGAWADAWHLAADMSFLEAKCRELGVHEAEADVAWVAERCRAIGDEGLRGRFGDLARALGRESHWLRAAPEATTALVWNRLRQFGWSADEIDQQLQRPAEVTFLQARHVVTWESPALVRDLVGHSFWVAACAVTPDGRRVVSASCDRTLKVWDLESGRELVTLQDHARRRLAVTTCVVTRDGRRVVWSSADPTPKVWDLESGRELVALQGHSAAVIACAMTPDGRRVVSASDDKTLKVWDLENGRELVTLQGHASGVTSCAMTPDGRRVVSASDDKTLKVWDLESGRELVTLQGHTSGVISCAVTPDGQRVVSTSSDQTLKVWNLESGRELVTLKGHAGWVRGCAVTPDGRRVVSASDDLTLKVWDLESGRELVTLQGHSHPVRACTVTPDGRRVVSASDDRRLKVWNLESGRALLTPQRYPDRVLTCAVAPDGRRRVVSASDEGLKVWDLESGRALVALRCHSHSVRACAVTPDGRRVVSASNDQTLKVWDLESGRELVALQGHSDAVRACAVTPDGRRVVSASDDQTLKVWDLESGRELITLQGHASVVRTCAVTPDGRSVVSASADETLKVWDLESGQALVALQGHSDAVRACAVTPDGLRVVSASDDQTLKVWDLKSGRMLLTLQGHSRPVTACAVTPDGQHIVSASSDQTLKVWNHESGECAFTHRASASFTAVMATATTIITGDVTGGVWVLDRPPPVHYRHSFRGGHEHPRRSSLDNVSSSSRPRMQRHTILFLAADPSGTDRLALDREARAIQVELERSGFRDCFELVTRWAAEPLDLLRELRKLKPTVVHFSGHSAPHIAGEPRPDPTPRHDIAGVPGYDADPPRRGLFFQSSDGHPQLVSTDAIAKTFGAAGSSVRLVVLSACHSNAQAKALLAHVDCVIGMSGSLSDAAARSFAIGFYGGLGEREPVAVAYEQGCAAISLEGLPDGDRPQLQIRSGVDANRLILAADPG